MEKIENLKSNIRTNLIKYRKQAGLTQAELAKKLGYSDKTVSKWEREEGVPDIYILKQIADLYNVTVNDLISPSQSIANKIKKSASSLLTRTNKILITLLSIGIVWFIAITVYVILHLSLPTFTEAFVSNIWVYAIPLSCIIAIVFSAIWSKNKWLTSLFISGLIWSIAASIYVTLRAAGFDGIAELFLIGVPLQILIVLWFLLDNNIRKKKDNNKKATQD